MIKATSQPVCSKVTGCQVEMSGLGEALLREYKAITVAMYRSLCAHMPVDMAKEVLTGIVTDTIKQAEEKR